MTDIHSVVTVCIVVEATISTTVVALSRVVENVASTGTQTIIAPWYRHAHTYIYVHRTYAYVILAPCILPVLTSS